MAAGQSVIEQQLAELSSDALATLEAGQYAVAEKLFRKLVQLQRRAFGPDHKATLINHTQLACALVGLGQHAQAKAILREVLQVQQQSPAYGMEHEMTLESVKMLGNSLVAQGRFKEAEPMLRKVHALDVRVLGPGSWETLTMQMTLGSCLAQCNQLEEAEELLRNALEGYHAWEEYPGRPEVKANAIASGMVELAKCIFMAGKHAEAESLLRAAVKYARHKLGEEDMITLACMTQHAHALATFGKHAAAEVMYRLTIQVTRTKFGWEGPETQSVTYNYMKCLVALQKWAAAVALLRDTLSHLQQALPEDHPTVLQYMQMLSGILEAYG